MDEKLGLTRRKFMIVSSVAGATPLLLSHASLVAETPKTRQGKLYYITQRCMGCQVCKTFCPANAINFGDRRNEIDQEQCIHCGTCYRECPVSAVSESD